MARIRTRTAIDGTPPYTAEVRLKGYPPQTATFKRQTDAKKWIQDTESAIREGRHFKTVEAKKHTVAEMIDRYTSEIAPKKFKSNEMRIRVPILNWWKSQLGYLRLSDLAISHFVTCRDELINRGGQCRKAVSG